MYNYYNDNFYYDTIFIRLLNNLQITKYPMFYLGVLKIILIIVESAKYELGNNINSELRCLFCGNDNFVLL